MGKIKNYEGRALLYLPNEEKERFKIYCADRNLNCVDIVRAGIKKQKELGIDFGKSKYTGPKVTMELPITKRDKQYIQNERKRMGIKETEYLEECIELGKKVIDDERGKGNEECI